MLTVGLLVRVHARPGKEAEIESFLRESLGRIEDDSDPPTWFALRINCATYGIFNAFTEDTGRQAHLSGKVAATLMERADELFVRPPTVERVDVLAAKLPT
ncbi:putative quinol monooxygenase [Sphaerisporangium sp. NPDC004334]